MQIDKELIQEFVERSQEHTYIIESGLLELEKGNYNVISEIMRSITSIRAQAEMLSIEGVTQRVVQLVVCLRRIRDCHLIVDRELITLLFKALDILISLLQHLEEYYSFSKSEIEQIDIQANPIFQTLESYIALLINPIQRFSEIESIFPLTSGANLAANDYGKKVEVALEGQDVLIPQVILKRLPRLLTHLLNNAIAHGIELPETRIAKGKPPTGKITLNASYKGNKAIISFSDDGAGIDVERVKNKAVSKGLVTAQKADLLSENDVFEFLFHPDFSTRDIRDMRAGTGYGLDIVRTEIKQIGGDIEVESKVDQGTKFMMIYAQNSA